MSSISLNDQRDVLPNWRDYHKTAKLGELFAFRVKEEVVPVFPINEYIEEWNEDKSLAYAGDLMSAAILNGQTNLPVISEVVQYVLENDESSEIIKRVANRIKDSDVSLAHDEQTKNSIELDDIEGKKEQIRSLVGFIRQNNKLFPYNPIAYCEMARCYTILGLQHKACEAMDIALHLAPYSRYISRCAARLYMQIGDAEHAHYVLLKNPSIKSDPWLIASEIAINSSMKRYSRFINIGKSLIQSQNYSTYSCSELASAIGTLEMSSGNRKLCTKFMNHALLQPNDNSLAQAEWLSSQNKDLRLKYHDYSSLILKAEADARFAYAKREFAKSYTYSIHWLDDYPYDKGAIYFSSHIAYMFLKDYESAIKILRLGLEANPCDTTIINNLAYVYALNDDYLSADVLMKQSCMNSVTSQDSIICHTATRGLIEFRKGNIELGNKLYTKAIIDAKDIAKDRILAYKAILNYLRELLLARKISVTEAHDIIDKVTLEDNQEIEQLKRDVVSEINRNSMGPLPIPTSKMNLDWL